MALDIKKLANLLLELIYPIKCLGCGREDFWLCPDCLKKIRYSKRQTCPVCQKVSPKGNACRGCLPKTNLNALIILGEYQDIVLQKIIHVLKYQFAFTIAEVLPKLLTNFFQSNKIFNSLDYLLIPVPLHKKRLKYRGFNQSDLIAEKLQPITGGKIIADNLTRVKYTRPQVELVAKARKKNVREAFWLSHPLEISGKSVILIDDVCTTGSTLEEAARVLKKAGAKEIIGFTIARG